MREQEALMINGVLIQDHHVSDTDDVGLGQIKISTIRIMIEEGKKLGLTFRLYKTVTARDSSFLTGPQRKRTVHADEDYLFVFPPDLRVFPKFWDLSEFWSNVEKAEKERTGISYDREDDPLEILGG